MFSKVYRYLSAISQSIGSVAVCSTPSLYTFLLFPVILANKSATVVFSQRETLIGAAGVTSVEAEKFNCLGADSHFPVSVTV